MCVIAGGGDGKNKQIGTNRVGVMCIGGFVVCGKKKSVGYKQRGALRSPMVKV